MNIIEEINSPEELLNYMDNNITYGFVGKNGKHYTDASSDEWYDQCIVQSGEELLESKIGTCWDQVELERLWFENHQYKYHTYFMWFEVERDNNLPTHTFLIYEGDNKYYWFEHAFEAQKGIHEFYTLDDAIEDVKYKQLEYTNEDINNLVVYEYTKPNNHLNVDEFLKHVTGR